jgi:predicted nucleic acid-binding protein
MKVIVSDTTSLIALEGLQSIELLCAVFESILIPQAVLNELSAGSPDIIKTINAVGCIEIIRLEPSEQLTSLQLILDPGEAEAITLALERQLPILIDERKGRAIAMQKNLTVTGFAGLLLLAVRKNVLTPLTAQTLLDQAIVNGFRISDKLYRQVSGALQQQ